MATFDDLLREVDKEGLINPIYGEIYPIAYDDYSGIPRETKGVFIGVGEENKRGVEEGKSKLVYKFLGVREDKLPGWEFEVYCTDKCKPENCLGFPPYSHKFRGIKVELYQRVEKKEERKICQDILRRAGLIK